MATTTPHEFDSRDPPPVAVRRFSLDEYHRMGEAGVLTEDDNVELLEGWIVPKMYRSPRHDAAIELAEEAVRGLLPPAYRLRIQSAITTVESQPEPDLAVVSGSARNRSARHPEPAEVALVIEVADSSLAQDQTVKARVYARAGIPCYWILNLVDSRVEVYSEPSGDATSPEYRQRRLYEANEQVPLIVSGADLGLIAVSDLLP